MGKIIKLTESELKDIIKLIMVEQFNTDYYDSILDLYNEVGLEGMTDEEIDYLKSGGESNVPDRFLGGDLDIEPEEKEDKLGNIEDFKSIMENNRHKVVDTAEDGKLRIVFKENEELLEEINNLLPTSAVNVVKGYIVVLVPERWIDDLFGEEI
jgi:hypothetical protein